MAALDRMTDALDGDRFVVARDSGWGDDDYFHFECDAYSGREGPRTLISLAGFPRSNWRCEYCHYVLDATARPDAPLDLE